MDHAKQRTAHLGERAQGSAEFALPMKPLAFGVPSLSEPATFGSMDW